MDGLFAWAEEALAPLGQLTMRKMMGGATLYLDGVVFAILADDEIWFKADAQNDASWDALGAERFSFSFKDGRTGTMNYRRGPADVHDDAEAMRRCAGLGLAAGLRGAARKSPRRAKGSR
jgi:DNA transformation protein